MIISAAFVLAWAYFIFFKDRPDFIWLLAISLGILVLSYVFQHPIDQLATRGVPQTLDPSMHQMLLMTAPYYARSPQDQQLLMQDRMVRWVLRKEFINKNEHQVPDDLKFILAYYGILLTLHQEDFRYDIFDRIAFYEHPFLTPSKSEEVHIVETESEDGTMIFSVPHLLKGHLEKGYYNIAIHATAEAYRDQYIKEDVSWDPLIWDKLENVSRISRPQMEAYLGFALNDPWPVAVHHQITYLGAEIEEVLHFFPQLKA